MIPLFRYLLLRTHRDGTLWVTAIAPTFVALAVLIGVSVSAQGLAGLHYPLVMDRRLDAAGTARSVAGIAAVMGTFMSVVPVFWNLRIEIATRSVGSIAMASRPAIIAIVHALYTMLVAVTSWLVTVPIIALLTAAFPSGLALLLLKVALLGFIMGSLVVLVVTISPEPPMMISLYAALIFVVPAFEKNDLTPYLLIPFAASLAVMAISTYLLERRCAR